MKLEIGPVACECPHCGAANMAALEMETMERSYVMQCDACAREFLLREINVIARIEAGAISQNVTAITAKDCR